MRDLGASWARKILDGLALIAHEVSHIARQFAELRICERLHDHEALHEKFAGEPPEALMGRYQARIIGHRDILTRLELE
jgi:hypothetical protein